MGFLLNLLTGGILNKVIEGIRAIFGDAQSRDQQRYDLNTATLQEFTAEFRTPRNIFDSIIDGLNRLPRPCMALGVIGLFVWCVIDPVEFSISINALNLIPEQMWLLMGVIVTFFFGDRTIQGFMKTKGPSKEDVSAVLDTQRALRDIDNRQAGSTNAGARVGGPMTSITSGEYEKEMADHSHPLSNQVIAEWNRRRRKQ